MDNVIQNIKLEDIVPSKFQIDNSQNDLKELAVSIKNYGIIEPLLVRPKNGKYEIILGNKRYAAAKMIGLKTIPVLIKNVDDEIVRKYQEINNLSKKEVHSQNEVSIKQNSSSKKNKEMQNIRSKIPLEQNPKNFNSDNNPTDMYQSIMNYNINNVDNRDIVNLSELNKEEYERDDIKMNNGQLNNNVMNNNMPNPAPLNSQAPAEPAFGGRFFPSLEDEPTNMNMGGVMANQPPISQTPPINEQNNGNLIDLTGPEPEPQMNNTPNFQTPSYIQPGAELNQSIANSSPAPEVSPSIPNLNQPPAMGAMDMPQTPEIPNSNIQPDSNVINLENLQNSTSINSQPVMAPEANIGMPGIVPEFPNIEQPQVAPQFDMSQNIASAPVMETPVMNQPMEPTPVNPIPEPNMSVAPGIETQPMMQDLNNIPNITNPVAPAVPEATQPIAPATPALPPKDIMPVINTIKSLATNLETFGYKLTINEEELPTSIRISIDVEK